jgi:hypothetical protein
MTVNFQNNIRVDEGGLLNDTGNVPVLPLGISFQTHSHIQGIIRLLRSSNVNLGNKGTIAGQTFMYLHTAASTLAGLAIPWDGSTAFP